MRLLRFLDLRRLWQGKHVFAKDLPVQRSQLQFLRHSRPWEVKAVAVDNYDVRDRGAARRRRANRSRAARAGGGRGPTAADAVLHALREEQHADAV
jgi:hypothetical protein